ncbi:Leucine-Rich Repeat Transmembrane Protein Flrt2 [Manis pentadactyla]|nr:Leucine-Rich Repeat Transmembrane Protein Flrt2 [Manis pentadactyla]
MKFPDVEVGSGPEAPGGKHVTLLPCCHQLIALRRDHFLQRWPAPRKGAADSPSEDHDISTVLAAGPRAQAAPADFSPPPGFSHSPPWPCCSSFPTLADHD